MQAALLSVFKKRNYTPYEHTRALIWESRDELLEYEQALGIDKLLDEILEEKTEVVAQRTTKTPGKYVTPGPTRNQTTPLRTPGSVANVKCETPIADWGDDMTTTGDVEPVLEIKKGDKIKKHLEEWLFPKWLEYVAVEDARGVRVRPPGFERFDAGKICPCILRRERSNVTCRTCIHEDGAQGHECPRTYERV